MKDNDEFLKATDRKKEKSKYEGMPLEDGFTHISKDARNLLQSKEEDMKIIAMRILREQLEIKLKNVSEKPIDILKRINEYVKYEKDIEEPPAMAAAAVKIIIFD